MESGDVDVAVGGQGRVRSEGWVRTEAWQLDKVGSLWKSLVNVVSMQFCFNLLCHLFQSGYVSVSILTCFKAVLGSMNCRTTSEPVAQIHMRSASLPCTQMSPPTLTGTASESACGVHLCSHPKPMALPFLTRSTSVGMLPSTAHILCLCDKLPSTAACHNRQPP